MAGRGSLSRSGAPTSLGSGPSVVRKQESRWQKMGFMINDSKDVSPAVVIVVFSALSRPLLGSCRKVAAPMQSCRTCTCTHCTCRKVAVVRQKFVAVVFPASVCVKVFDAHLHKFRCCFFTVIFMLYKKRSYRLLRKTKLGNGAFL